MEAVVDARAQTDLRVAVYELQLNDVRELNMLITVCWTSIVSVVERVCDVEMREERFEPHRSNVAESRSLSTLSALFECTVTGVEGRVETQGNSVLVTTRSN